MMFENSTHLNKQVHNQLDEPSELGTSEKGNSTAINEPLLSRIGV